MNKLTIVALLSALVDEHFAKQEETLRQFKWIANVPMSGDEYVKNINVFELQDKAAERLKKKKQDCINLLNSIK